MIRLLLVRAALHHVHGLSCQDALDDRRQAQPEVGDEEGRAPERVVLVDVNHLVDVRVHVRRAVEDGVPEGDGRRVLVAAQEQPP